MPTLKQEAVTKKKSKSLNTSNDEGTSGEALGALPIMSPSEALDKMMHDNIEEYENANFLKPAPYVPKPPPRAPKPPPRGETFLQRKFAQRWYLKLWHKKIKGNTEVSYKGLQYGKIWSDIDPNFDRQKMASLSKDNVHKLENNVYRFAKEAGYKTSDVDEFVKEFCKLDFILAHFTDRTHHFHSLKSQTLLRGKSQKAIVRSLSDSAAHNKVIGGNTMASDITRLSNNEFIFFKFQLNPKRYSPLHYHRSRFGSNAYIFPLHKTSLLRLGHIYTLDPAYLSDSINNIKLSLFQDPVQSDDQKIREVKPGGWFYYPLTKKERVLKANENTFYGPLILKGVALYVLNEAYHMHLEIFRKLIADRNTLEDGETLPLLDTLLANALKIQALIPRRMGTAFSEFGRVEQSGSSLNKLSDAELSDNELSDAELLDSDADFFGSDPFLFGNESSEELSDIVDKLFSTLPDSESSDSELSDAELSDAEPSDNELDNLSESEVISKFKELIDELSLIDTPIVPILIKKYNSDLKKALSEKSTEDGDRLGLIKLLIEIIPKDIKRELLVIYENLISELSSIDDPISLELLPMYKGAIEDEESLDLGALKLMIESIQGTISSAKMFEKPGPSEDDTHKSEEMAKYQGLSSQKISLYLHKYNEI